MGGLGVGGCEAGYGSVVGQDLPEIVKVKLDPRTEEKQMPGG